jgi:hypothetical protein
VILACPGWPSGPRSGLCRRGGTDRILSSLAEQSYAVKWMGREEMQGRRSDESMERYDSFALNSALSFDRLTLNIRAFKDLANSFVPVRTLSASHGRFVPVRKEFIT